MPVIWSCFSRNITTSDLIKALGVEKTYFPLDLVLEIITFKWFFRISIFLSEGVVVSIYSNIGDGYVWPQKTSQIAGIHISNIWRKKSGCPHISVFCGSGLKMKCIACIATRICVSNDRIYHRRFKNNLQNATWGRSAIYKVKMNSLIPTEEDQMKYWDFNIF